MTIGLILIIISIFIIALLLFCLVKVTVFGEDEKIYGFKIVIKEFLDGHKKYEIHRKKAHDLLFFIKFWESFRTYDTYDKAKDRLLECKKEYEEKLAKTTVTKKIEIF
jgi:hypothetical protein